MVEHQPAEGVVLAEGFDRSGQQGFLWDTGSIEEPFYQLKPPEGSADSGKLRLVKGNDRLGGIFPGGNQAVQPEGERIPVCTSRYFNSRFEKMAYLRH